MRVHDKSSDSESVSQIWDPCILFSASNMFPIWQLGHDVIPSNGSTSHKQLRPRPSGWWLDMDIDVQMQCEKAISKSCRTVHFRYKFTDYLIDIESMTQLNLKSGTLRRIRRLQHLP